MFVRFISPQIDTSSKIEEGIFCAAYRLSDSSNITEWDREILAELMHWFDDNLPRPACFDGARTAGEYERAICWFQPTAVEHIRRARELAILLELNGEQIRLIRTRQPGRVYYEDKAQVVARPYPETFAYR